MDSRKIFINMKTPDCVDDAIDSFLEHTPEGYGQELRAELKEQLGTWFKYGEQVTLIYDPDLEAISVHSPDSEPYYTWKVRRMNTITYDTIYFVKERTAVTAVRRVANITNVDPVYLTVELFELENGEVRGVG